MEAPDPQTEVRMFVGCWLDALNQKKPLEQWEDAFNQGHRDKPALLPHIQDSYGKVRFLQRQAREWTTAQKDAMAPRDWEKNLDAETRKDVEHLKERNTSYFFFADTQVVFAPLRFHKKIPMLGDALSVLWYCAAVMVLGASNKIAVRGSIELGQGIYDQEGGPYGPLFSRLYQLENSVADYPRVVVGKQLYNFLHEDTSRLPDHGMYGHTKFLQRQAQGLITIDDDGIPIVDYLGEHASKQRAGMTLKQSVPPAIEWIYTCYNEFKSKSGHDLSCQRLANRYCRWNRYAHERVSHWK